MCLIIWEFETGRPRRPPAEHRPKQHGRPHERPVRLTRGREGGPGGGRAELRTGAGPRILKVSQDKMTQHLLVVLL